MSAHTKSTHGGRREGMLLCSTALLPAKAIFISVLTYRCWCPSAHTMVTALKKQKTANSSSATPSSFKICGSRENSFQSWKLWHIWRKLYMQLLEYHLLWLYLLQTSETKTLFPMHLLFAWNPKCCRIIFSVNFLFITFSTLYVF